MTITRDMGRALARLRPCNAGRQHSKRHPAQQQQHARREVQVGLLTAPPSTDMTSLASHARKPIQRRRQVSARDQHDACNDDNHHLGAKIGASLFSNSSSSTYKANNEKLLKRYNRLRSVLQHNHGRCICETAKRRSRTTAAQRQRDCIDEQLHQRCNF